MSDIDAAPEGDTSEQDPWSRFWPHDQELHNLVDSFLSYEADLLDSWQLERWLELFDPRARFVVPSASHRGSANSLGLLDDDYFMLESARDNASAFLSLVDEFQEKYDKENAQ